MSDNYQIEDDKGNILVVDDNPTNLLLLSKILSGNGYKVQAAPNGNFALRIVEQSDLPDLILLDIMMPEPDGYEVCRRLKASERSRNIPVIFISALNETMEKLKAFSLGGIDFITKPFISEEVLARVKTHLTLSRMPKQLEIQNIQLQHEINERQQVQMTIQKAHDELEIRVQERTKALAEANQKLQQLVAELEQACQAAKAAYQTETAFLANMSHEFRTPLNIILGSTQLLLFDQRLGAKQREGINTIHDSGEYLLTIVNDILELSQMETGALELQLVDLHLEKFLQKIVHIFHNRAVQKRLAFVYEPAALQATGIYADEKRLRQILVHLLSNAVKFTERGNITFKVVSEPLRVTNDSFPFHSAWVTLHFEVIDTGIGIAPADLEKIFLPFEQLSDWKSKSAGAGLGLSIAKKQVEAMGGRLQVESTLGKGSRFWTDLMFPESLVWMKPESPQAAFIVGYAGPRRKILVVDDHEENRGVVDALLSPLGFEILEASNGREGLEKVCNCRPDLLLTDLVMPVMDGFELMREIRKMPEFQQLPILAESASLVEYSQFSEGIPYCNAFLLKPFNRQTLLKLLEEHLHLTWLYRQPNPPTEEESVIHQPVKESSAMFKGLSSTQAKQLLELTARGDFGEILELLELLEQEDVELRPVVAKIRSFARQFDDVSIEELVQSYL
jgi:signal transduction histidine kinase